MKNLFIDANIWLSVYHFTSDTLDKFEALKNLLGDDIHLFVPEQVYHEVLRNRDTKIKNVWDDFKSFHFQTPAFCQSYSEFETFQRKYKELLDIHTKWRKEVERDIQNISLRADTLLFNVFQITKLRSVSADIVARAEIRFKSGNPPGKNNSLGDAINWEYLLARIPNGEDLYFISSDKDYCSSLDPSRFNLFLLREWKSKKKSNIFFFRNLSDFLKDHAKSVSHARSKEESDTPNDSLQEQKIKGINALAESIDDSLDSEEKQNAIMLLQNSCSYANTHNAISLLSKYNSWTPTQVEALCEAVLANSQVYNIFMDDDVLEFYSNLIKKTDAKTEAINFVREEVSGVDCQ